MKTFSVAVAVAVVLTFICLQQSSADPLPEEKKLQEPENNDQQETTFEDVPVEVFMEPEQEGPQSADQQQTAVKSQRMPYIVSEKLDKRLKCRYYCSCCPFRCRVRCSF